jgi:hypothetical protein
MQTNAKLLLWRVEWSHRNGYQAPYQLIWAKTRKEATIELKTRSRLADFPETWSYRLLKLTTEETPKRNRRK